MRIFVFAFVLLAVPFAAQAQVAVLQTGKYVPLGTQNETRLAAGFNQCWPQATTQATRLCLVRTSTTQLVMEGVGAGPAFSREEARAELRAGRTVQGGWKRDGQTVRCDVTPGRLTAISNFVTQFYSGTIADLRRLCVTRPAGKWVISELVYQSTATEDQLLDRAAAGETIRPADALPVGP